MFRGAPHRPPGVRGAVLRGPRGAPGVGRGRRRAPVSGGTRRLVREADRARPDRRVRGLPRVLAPARGRGTRACSVTRAADVGAGRSRRGGGAGLRHLRRVREPLSGQSAVRRGRGPGGLPGMGTEVVRGGGVPDTGGSRRGSGGASPAGAGHVGAGRSPDGDPPGRSGLRLTGAWSLRPPAQGRRGARAGARRGGGRHLHPGTQHAGAEGMGEVRIRARPDPPHRSSGPEPAPARAGTPGPPGRRGRSAADDPTRSRTTYVGRPMPFP